MPESVSPDGKLVTVRNSRAGEPPLVFSMGEPPSPGRNPHELVRTPALGTRFSPDGELIAYNSSESGRSEIYVQSLRGAMPRWTISTDGGEALEWAGGGRELLYRRRDRMMAVGIERSPRFRASQPALLFERRYLSGVFAVTPDGTKFLMVKGPAPAAEEPAEQQLHVIVNWSDELLRRVPVK